MELKYSEILRRNADLSRNLPADRYKIAILSNVIVSQAKEILEYTLRVESIPADVTIGGYDNIVQDSLECKDRDLLAIFWEPYNITDGLLSRIELFSEQQVDEVFEKTRAELEFVFRNLQDASLVLINTFSALPFSVLGVGVTKLDELSARLNQYLKANAPGNVRLVDVEKIIAQTGVDASFDLRYWYSSKAPYTVEFFKTYSRYVKPLVMSANGRSKKAIIFDCDNTLWKGVLGEEGYSSIEMSSSTKDGAIFAEVQSIALHLSRQGVLVGLCSKNNPEDVDEVIRSHPDMQLREEHITVRRVNWTDKVSNLKEMARELNIGLDSLVMIDDSPFEANLIREQLPEVTVLQVPESLYLYPKMLRANYGLFYNLSSTGEDTKKAGMYRDQAKREASKLKIGDMDSYLASLGTKMTIYQDEASIVPRMAQLTQKTNQFNLTTRRYTDGDIAALIKSDLANVIAFAVGDKFGDSGVTGLCIIRIVERHTAVIDTLLMSCRVLGRQIEYAFLNFLIEYLKGQGIRQVNAKYIRTSKNAQVMEFFDRCSFSLNASTEVERDYSLSIQDYKPKQIDCVEIIDGSTRSYQECYGGSV